MGKEFELKYAATADQLQRIVDALPGEYTAITMETTYYDTPAGDLSARKWTLRRRLENGVSVCTLKTPALGFGRNEWELEQDSIEAAIYELCKLSNLPELQVLTADGVIPVCGARFTRLARTVTAGNSILELALDQGILFSGSREQPFAELEVELKSGVETKAVLYAHALAARFGLKEEARSKFRRALDLAKGE